MAITKSEEQKDRFIPAFPLFFPCSNPKHLHLICSLVLFLVGIDFSRGATAYNATLNGGDEDWSNTSTWSPSGIPGSADSVKIGTASGNNTTVTVNGETEAVAALTVGDTSSVSTPTLNTYGLTIENGGVLTEGGTAIINDLGGSGTVTVDGIGSQWNVTGTIEDGFRGTSGSIVVENGGAITSSGSFFVALSETAGATNAASLTIESGGTVTDTTGVLGDGATATATATVTGANSKWSLTSGTLEIGHVSGSSATLIVQDGGTVDLNNGAGTLSVGQVSGATGILDIGDGSTAGTIQAATVTAVAGATGTVNFGETDEAYAFAPQLTGVLSVNQNGSGTTTLSAANTYTGPTTVTSGGLNITGSITASSGTTVTNGTLSGTGNGLVGGTGSITGPVTIGNGTNAAGTAFFAAHDMTLSTPTTGEFRVNGALTLNSDAVFSLYLNTAAATPTSDLTLVVGPLTLNNATLSASDLGSGTVAAGTVFDIMNYGTETGTFAGLVDGSEVTIGSNEFDINYGTAVADEITLTSIAVPEPTSTALLLGGLAAMSVMIRRKRDWQA